MKNSRKYVSGKIMLVVVLRKAMKRKNKDGGDVMFKLLFCQALYLFDLTLKTFLLTEILTMPTGLKMKREKT